jgi:hypothetical protein
VVVNPNAGYYDWGAMHQNSTFSVVNGALNVHTQGAGTNAYFGLITAPLNSLAGAAIFDQFDAQLADWISENFPECDDE